MNRARQTTRGRHSRAEATLWPMWRFVTESVTSLVARDISAATGLSGADHDVLSRLAELGRGTLRQQDLANALGWHKSRLSHHLSRMEQRALVKRKQTAPSIVLVSATRHGQHALRGALPVEARAVRTHLLAHLSHAQRIELCELLARIAKAAPHHARAAPTMPAERSDPSSKKRARSRAARQTTGDPPDN